MKSTLFALAAIAIATGTSLPLRADVAAVPARLLDRNSADGEVCAKLCYTFGANVEPPFHFAFGIEAPSSAGRFVNLFGLGEASHDGPNIIGIEDPRIFADPGGLALVKIVGDATIPAGTTVCFTVTENLFRSGNGAAFPPDSRILVEARRISDGFNIDVLGNAFFDPVPGKVDIVFKDRVPLQVDLKGGPNQDLGKVQILGPDGNPFQGANVAIGALGDKLLFDVDPADPTGATYKVTLPADPSTLTSQDEAIASGGTIDAEVSVTDDGAEVANEVIGVQQKPETPEATSKGTRRSAKNDSNTISLDEILGQLSAGDPISMATGAFFFTESLIELGGPLPLKFRLAYGSDAFPHESGVGLPEKFEHNHRALISAGAGADADALVTLGMGRELTFERTGFGPWLLGGGEQITYTLAETGGHYLLVDPSTNIVAHLVAVADRNGNALRYTPAADPRSDGPSSVSDGRGRTLTFSYTPLGTQGRKFLTRIEDQTARAWTLQYETSPADNAGGSEVTLRSLTDPLGGLTTYTYAGQDRIAGVQQPGGNTPYTQTYGTGDGATRVASQTDALNRTTTIAKEFAGVPGFGATQFKLTNPDGAVERYFHNADGTLMSAMTDAAGNTMRFEQDGAFKRVKKTIDRDGAVTEIGYDPISGKVSQVKNARGETTAFNHNPPPPFPIRNPDNGELVFIGDTFSDLSQIFFPDFTFRSFQRDIITGNPTRITDRANDRDTFTYDFVGNVLTRTNGEGGVTTFTYDAAANLASRTSTDTGTTTYAYDALNRLTALTRPDATTLAFTYDALDRVVTRTDERGIVTEFDYDPNSNLTAVTRDFGGPLAQTFAFEYDALDRLVRITDPATNATVIDYPYHDQPSSITLPDGEIVQFGYDARRALTSATDELGHTASFDLDPAEQLRQATSPENRSVTLERDPLGAVTASIDHTGDRSAAALDVNSRALTTTDQLGRQRSVLRDGEGRVTKRTEPVSGDTRYAYDDNGRLERLTDARGKIWNFAYTPMGRLQTMTDPNSRTTSYSYDSRGRLFQKTHPDTVTETLSYDPSSNLTARTFSDGLTLGFSYDSLDRLTATASTPVASPTTAGTISPAPPSTGRPSPPTTTSATTSPHSITPAR